MFDEDLVALPTGEIKSVMTLNPAESVEFCEWLLDKADRANRLATQIADGTPSACDYWDTSTRSFCDDPAVLVTMPEPASGWVSDPPRALCVRHRILAL
jgi:hypothetical protein